MKAAIGAMAIALMACGSTPKADPPKRGAPCASERELMNSARPTERAVRVADVNDDAREEWAIPDGCGSGGCSYDLFISVGPNCFVFAGSMFGKGIGTEGEKTNGLRRLAVTGGTPHEPAISQYEWDGHAYKLTGSWPWKGGAR